MASKLQAVIGMADKLTSDLTAHRGAWRQFLQTAARVYKYSFSDQLLIFGQRPDATACAELSLWNDRMGRWVNRGAHGIALIDTRGRRPRLRYVFDVSDTHPSRERLGRPLRLWTIRPEQQEAVSVKLEQMYPDAGITGMGFEEKIIKICELAVKSQLACYLEQLEQLKADSLLEELDELNLSMWLRLPLEASVGYIVLTRCGVDAAQYYDDADYEHIYDFSTPQTLSVLGNAASNISRALLLELGKLARSLSQDVPQHKTRRKPAAPRRPASKSQDQAEPVEQPAPAAQSKPEPEPEAAAISGSDIPGATTPEHPAPVEPEAAPEPVKSHHLPLGTTVYIGSREFVLVAYGDNSVTLCEPDCPLFQDVMPRTEFDVKVAENSLNEHLLTEGETTRPVAELLTNLKQTIQPETETPATTEQTEPEQREEAPAAPPTPRRPRKISPAVLHPEIPEEQRHNYHIHDDALGVGTPGEKFARNVRAIRLLKKLEAEGRFATPEEQEILAQYVGWGGLADCFEKRHSKYAELKALLTEEEYTAARASTLNAHYTTPVVIRAVYDVLANMGFQGGNILEPSCGVGNFFGMLPEAMGNSKLYGVELDSLTGRIAQQLYQRASITVQGYERVSYPKDFFDVAVGNVPFGSYQVNDKAYNRLGFSIHNYFFAKALDQVRPGGIVAFVTSRYTMDAKDPAVRRYLAQRAELLGAIRLPNNAFKANAGTEVVTDIIFLQKREHIDLSEPAWVQLGETADGFAVNRYFIDHPEMVLGVQTSESTQYGRQDFTVIPIEGASLENQLAEAIQNIHGMYTEAAPAELEDAEADNSIPADPAVRNYSYTVVDGKVYFRENSRMTPVALSGTAEGRVKGLIGLRDCVRTFIEYQTEDYPDEDIQAEQRKLNTLYDVFVRKYGRITARANNTAFRLDSSYFLLSSLEVLDDEGKFVRKADMFSKRTIKRRVMVSHVDTSSEALALSMGERAKVDMPYMMELTGKTENEIYKDLQGVIFLNPLHDDTDARPKYLPADEYLSGNVREKLTVAKRSAELHPEDYTVNVKALESVQPTDLTAAEISVRLGATWLPVDVVNQFMYELMGTPWYMRDKICVHYSQYTGDWRIEGKSADRSSVQAYSTYGTNRANGYKIIEETLNLRTVRIFDYIEDEHGNRTPVLNKKETAIAQGKQELIKQTFQDWIWKDPQRRERLCKLYNEKFNSIRPREYDGSHLNFVGINPAIQLRPHQVNAIARILYGGNTLLAHVVGGGKTFEMVAAGMESKRLGLCQKSLYVVPNHLTEQWATEFLQLYPAANILVATRRDFETKNRKRFCGRIATGDFDAIIIGHSQFEKIPMSIERQRYILEQQERDILDGLAELKANHGERFSIKQLERARKSIQAKLEKLNDQSRKDDVVTFEELGVDRLFVDEAHYYKNLAAFSKMRNVGGISQTEAQKSSDLYMKCRYLDELTGGRGVIFATGTPVSNTMVELYTMQKYLQHQTLEEHGLLHFDAWASTFGETVTAIELAPEGTGYRAKTRFARFYNLPELMSMFKEIADIQTADMLHLPVPKANYHNIVLKPSEHQKEMVAALSERAEKVRNKMVDPSVDNMLRITNDGRKLALDQRMMNPMLPASETGKVSACAGNVYAIWKRTAAQKSTQLVFCDRVAIRCYK